MDMALGFSNDRSKFDDLVLSTLHTSSVLCWIIKSIEFCSNDKLIWLIIEWLWNCIIMVCKHFHNLPTHQIFWRFFWNYYLISPNDICLSFIFRILNKFFFLLFKILILKIFYCLNSNSPSMFDPHIYMVSTHQHWPKLGLVQNC
jgi:hypothetical protein